MEQQLTCLHGTAISARCAQCGGIVGIDAPKITRGQIWRARGVPHARVGVLAAAPYSILYLTETGRGRMDPRNFATEFWFWGQPSQSVRRAAFEERFRPIRDKLATARTPDEMVAAQRALGSALEAFKVQYGYAPEVKLLQGPGYPRLAVNWPLEDIIRSWVKGP